MRVSCILPVRNGERYLRECLDSILGQLGADSEVLLIDDASEDNTAQIAGEYPQVKILRNDTAQGPPASRNRGIQVAQGEFLCFSDCDDTWPKDRLQVQLRRFKERPELEICLGHVQNFMDDPQAVLPERLRKPVPAYSSAAMLCRRSAFERLGLFNAQLQHASDAQWFLEARHAKLAVEMYPEVVLFRRLHRSNFSLMNGDAARDDFIYLLKGHLDRCRQSPLQQLFQRLLGRSTGETREVSRYGVAGGRVELRTSDPSLVQTWMEDWAPFRLQEEFPADLIVDVVPQEQPEQELFPLEPALPPRLLAMGLVAGADQPVMAVQRPGLLALYDTRRQRAVAALAPERLLPSDAAKPLQLFLLQWLTGQKGAVFHAAVASRNGRAVLLLGDEHAGKSTLLAACLEDGWDFGGDDLVMLRPGSDGAICASPLYSCMWLEPQQAALFPSLVPALQVHPLEPKALIRIGRRWPERVSPGAQIVATVVCSERPGEWESISRAEVVKVLAGSSFHKLLGRHDQAKLDLAASVAQQGPCFRMGRGMPLPQVVRRLGELVDG